MAAFPNQRLDGVEELRSLGWEVLEGEDLYGDVKSLESFSISSGDGEEQEYEGVCADRDVSGLDLEVTSAELHDYGFGFGVGAFCAGDCDEDDDDLDDSLAGAARDGDVVALVGQLGFHVSGGTVEADVDNGVIRDSQPSLRRDMVMFTPSGGYVRATRCLHTNYVEDHHLRDFLDKDDDDGGYEVDVDDELVPWGVTNRLEKQRMRKLGKRTFARMNKSKKMAHFYTKPACLRGKHGLGLKAY